MGLKRQRLCSFFFVTKWANCANNPGTCTIRDGNCEGKMRDSKQFWKCRTVTNGFFWTELFRNPFQLELHSKLLITNYREVVKKKNGFTIRLTIKVSFLWFFGVSKGTGVFRSKNSFQWVKIFIFSYGQGWWAPSPYSQPDRKISVLLRFFAHTQKIHRKLSVRRGGQPFRSTWPFFSVNSNNIAKWTAWLWYFWGPGDDAKTDAFSEKFQKFILQCGPLNKDFLLSFPNKFATWFSENEGGGQRPFGTIPKIDPFWYRHSVLRYELEKRLRSVYRFVEHGVSKSCLMQFVKAFCDGPQSSTHTTITLYVKTCDP